MSVRKVPEPDQAATSSRAKNKEGPKPGEHVQLFRMERDRNKGFYSKKRQLEASIALYFEWAGCLVPRDVLPPLPPYCCAHRTDMLKLLQNLQEYCELRWTAILQAPAPSPDTKQRNAQRAKERRETKEPSPSIRERIPKLKYTSSLLPAMHTPKTLTGRGGGQEEHRFVRG